MRRDLCQFKHYRGGKYGRVEQAFEEKMNDLLYNIRVGASGYYHNVADFTTKKSGLLDTGKVKEIADAMVSSPGDYVFKDEGEKKFYYSFLYCALVLCSLDFEYVPPEDPAHQNFFSFKRSNFKKLIENADILQDRSEDGILGLEGYGLYEKGFPTLYTLLSGKTIEFASVYEEIELSEKEWQEIMEDEEADHVDPEAIIEDEALAHEEKEDVRSKEEIAEENEIMAGKIKAMYPGFMDFVTNLENFKNLFDQYASTGFFEAVREMVGQFLAEGGYTLYNNENALVSSLVQIRKANGIMKKALYGKEK